MIGPYRSRDYFHWRPYGGLCCGGLTVWTLLSFPQQPKPGHAKMSRSKTVQTEEAPIYCILRCRQVQQRTGLSRSSIYALIGKEQFPVPVRLSAQSVGWFEHEINGWISQRSRSMAAPLGAPQ